jgi:ABC-type transport system involved in multi-copper enzyme maturation permease subunit
MRNIISAEWRKAHYNRWLMGFTVWILPLGALVFLGVSLVFALLNPEGMRNNLNLNWRDQMMLAWQLPTGFFGQLFVVVLAATLFAGESGMNTWKNLVPRARRWHLVVAKFVVVLVLMLLAYNLLVLVVGLLSVVLPLVLNMPVQPPPAEVGWGVFATDYLESMLVSMVSVLLSTSFAVLGALAARTVQVGIMLGLGVMLFEQVLPVLLLFLARLLDVPGIVSLHHLTPSYNLQNLAQWLQQGKGFTPWEAWPGFTPNAASTSALILLLWVIVLVTISIFMFLRRDVA